ncbi:ankyrin repeat protein [Moumouvirus australiensis]|uniref:Ankyrin repeat protein n=1 Tax=Moumouvirus australiensis TaxID=2109587 RepID=A0A2P1EKW5_9VIRU|nr:ankyrin repeat protein [Moumouvirus australiensis]AVL94507.1 ankyrin repeat protein [Moumouvirus australiensis]
MDFYSINILPVEIWNLIFEHSNNYNLLFASKYYFELLNLITNNDNILEQAIINGHLHIVLYINYLKKKGNVLMDKINFKSLGLQNYFYIACKFGHIDIVRYLHSQGANIIEDDNKALIEACTGGHKIVVEYLLSKGANMYAKDNYPIIIATINGYLDIVSLFVSMNHNILGLIYIPAIDNNQLEIVKFLRSSGLDIHIYHDYGLRKSAECNYFDLLKYLISEGANIRVYQNYAITKSFQNGHYEVVKYLLSLGIDVVKENVGIYINHVLNKAVVKCDLELVELLISMGTNITQILALAKKYNCHKIIEFVEEKIEKKYVINL